MMNHQFLLFLSENRTQIDGKQKTIPAQIRFDRIQFPASGVQCLLVLRSKTLAIENPRISLTFVTFTGVRCGMAEPVQAVQLAMPTSRFAR
jgi:hypothetical protein